MSVRDHNKVLYIKDGLTGEVTVVDNFFDVSHFTQISLIEDLAMPILLDKGSIYLSIGYIPEHS